MNWTLRCLARPKAVMALLAAGAALVAGLSAALGVTAHAGGQHAVRFVAAAGPPPVIVEEDERIADVAHLELAAANPPPDQTPVGS